MAALNQSSVIMDQQGNGLNLRQTCFAVQLLCARVTMPVLQREAVQDVGAKLSIFSYMGCCQRVHQATEELPRVPLLLGENHLVHAGTGPAQGAPPEARLRRQAALRHGESLEAVPMNVLHHLLPQLLQRLLNVLT